LHCPTAPKSSAAACLDPSTRKPKNLPQGFLPPQRLPGPPLLP
jgi:hypothetical protein